MTDNQKKTNLIIVDEISSDSEIVKVLKRLKISDGVEPDDAVTMQQLEDNSSDVLTDDNAFEGYNQFIQPISVAPAENDDEAITLGQLNDALSFRNYIDVVPGDKMINWQTDLVTPDKTFAQLFGNNLFKALLNGDDGTGFITTYEGNLKYTKTDDEINQVAVENILYAGKLTFI